MAPSAKITDFFNKRLSTEDSEQRPKRQLSRIPDDEKVKQQQQTFLDLGQKGLGQKTCKECGMCYDPSFKEDLQRHAKFHTTSLNNSISFDPPQTTEPVMTDQIGGHSLYILDCHQRQVTDLIERINSEMAAAPLEIKSNSKLKVYILLTSDHFVSALAIIEPIKEAYGAIPHKDPSLVCQLTDTKFPAAIGISRIWVAPGSRRKGLAVHLLDLVRQNAAKPLKVGIKSLAFSQPTSDGFALASRYQSGCFPTAACLVYR